MESKASGSTLHSLGKQATLVLAKDNGGTTPWHSYSSELYNGLLSLRGEPAHGFA